MDSWASAFPADGGVGRVKAGDGVKGLAGDEGQRDLRLGQLHVQMRAAEVPVEQRDEPLGVDEFDPVVTAETAVLVVKPVRIADRVALVGIDYERTVAVGEFSIRQ